MVYTLLQIRCAILFHNTVFYLSLLCVAILSTDRTAILRHRFAPHILTLIHMVLFRNLYSLPGAALRCFIAIKPIAMSCVFWCVGCRCAMLYSARVVLPLPSVTAFLVILNTHCILFSM